MYATEPLVKPPQKECDHVFEYKIRPLPPTSFKPSMDDMEKSFFDRNHWRQYHDVELGNCHGRFYLGVVIQQILGFYEGGDVRRVKKIKVQCSSMFLVIC